MIRTVTEVASEFGVNRVTIATKLKKMNCPMVGKTYIIDDNVYEILKKQNRKNGRATLPKLN